MKHAPWLALGVSTMLGGCSLIPHFSIPFLPVSKTYPTGAAYQGPTQTPARILHRPPAAGADRRRHPQ
jgi:hypothetical protein